jgi:hypothetical protein
MTPDELEAVKMISKALEGTSIALANLIVDLSPIIGNDERGRLLKIIEDACTGEENEQEQVHKEG